MNKTKHDLTIFLTAVYFNPVWSTLLQSIRNDHFTTWYGIEYEFISKRLIEDINSAEGYLNQERQCLQSTKRYRLSSSMNQPPPSPLP